jgi:hypothetical protein
VSIRRYSQGKPEQGTFFPSIGTLIKIKISTMEQKNFISVVDEPGSECQSMK